LPRLASTRLPGYPDLAEDPRERAHHAVPGDCNTGWIEARVPQDSRFWEDAEALFADAIDLTPPSRSALLDRRCADRPDLRAEVESLLAAHDRSDRFLAVASGQPADANDCGRLIGPFRLTDRIGYGGMGVVYAAERADGEFSQRVAVKLLDAAMRDDVRRRFRAERQILASLQHPHIVTLLDGGVTADGRAYLVMEYIDGVPISTHCADAALSLEARLRLFQDVCAAVQYAHQHGIVHRDLKPANILVAGGTVKVLDLGIAKLVDASGEAEMTIDAARALTPNYAAPEQLRGLPVTTATDLYALGVLLYELIAGVRPYETANQTLDRILAIVVDQEPKRPSARDDVPGLPYAIARLRGDLDAIVAKAMSKDPAQRYASARELADDIQRHLDGQPVMAREPSLWYVARRFGRRHRPAVAAAAVSLVALVGALGVSLWQTRVALRERDRATARFNDTRELAHALIFSIHDQVRPLPGSTPVRRAIISEALKYLERLSGDPDVDDALRLELAKGYHRVGNVQGNQGEPNLGDPQGALKSLEAAVALLRPIVASASASAEAAMELARTDLSLAIIASFAGARDRALTAVHEATAIAKDAVARHPEDAEARRLLGSALFHSAMLADDAQALPLWQQAGDVFGALLAEWPDDLDRQRNVALVEKYVGSLYERRQQYGNALAHYERALQIDEQILAREASSRRAQLDVAIDLGNLAHVHWSGDGLQQAAARYEQSLAIRARLAAADPKDVRLRRFEAYASLQLSAVYNEMHSFDRGLRHAIRAVAIGERLPEESGYQIDLMQALGELGLARIRTGDTRAGCRAYARAAAIGTRLGARTLTADVTSQFQHITMTIRTRQAACGPATTQQLARSGRHP
jgi:non-specific serine/threonine protein kinase/serine/threonine-protein kinase